MSIICRGGSNSYNCGPAYVDHLALPWATPDYTGLSRITSDSSDYPGLPVLIIKWSSELPELIPPQDYRWLLRINRITPLYLDYSDLLGINSICPGLPRIARITWITRYGFPICNPQWNKLNLTLCKIYN